MPNEPRAGARSETGTQQRSCCALRSNAGLVGTLYPDVNDCPHKEETEAQHADATALRLFLDQLQCFVGMSNGR